MKCWNQICVLKQTNTFILGNAVQIFIPVIVGCAWTLRRKLRVPVPKLEDITWHAVGTKQSIFIATEH